MMAIPEPPDSERATLGAGPSKTKALGELIAPPPPPPPPLLAVPAVEEFIIAKVAGKPVARTIAPLPPPPAPPCACCTSFVGVAGAAGLASVPPAPPPPA